MQIVRKLLLVALTAIAAMALAASSASAVEISDESSGEHCSAVTVDGHGVTGGCALIANSVGHTWLEGAFGIDVRCETRFEARTDENGVGALYAQQTALNCEQRDADPCTAEGEVTPWPFNVTGSGPTYNMEADFCVVVESGIIGDVTVNCHLAGVTVTPTEHTSATFDVDQNCESSSTNAVHGSWVAAPDAAHPAVEIAP